MRKIILLGMVLLPCTAFAVSDCRVVEFADHYEAICVGTDEQIPASTRNREEERIPGQEQNLASTQTLDGERAEVFPEMIVRNNLARLHGATWLKNNPR